MAIGGLQIQRAGATVFLLSWWSDLANPTFRVYRDGQLVATTDLAERIVSVAPGESPVFEVLDDPDAVPSPAYPSYLLLAWHASPGTDRYLVQQFDGSTWITRRTITDDGAGYFTAATGPLADDTVHQWRVLPVGDNGNQGTPHAFAALMVRHPDPPAVLFAYNGAVAGTVTITQA